MIFYTSAHTGVMYDCNYNEQFLLQGHVSDTYTPTAFLYVMRLCPCRATRSLVLVRVPIRDGCLPLMWGRTALYQYGTHILGMGLLYGVCEVWCAVLAFQ